MPHPVESLPGSCTAPPRLLSSQRLPVHPPARRDRPDCEQVEGSGTQNEYYHLLGALVHCNVRLQGDSMQRLVHFADNAMRAWAARTGHYEVLDSITTQATGEGAEETGGGQAPAQDAEPQGGEEAEVEGEVEEGRAAYRRGPGGRRRGGGGGGGQGKGRVGA